jgi:hypothetical protein
MDQNFLFRWIWRFNAIGLAVALILFGWSVYGYYTMMSTLMPGSTVIIGADGDEAKSDSKALRLFLDYAREGRREMVFALAPEQKMPVAYPDSSKIGYQSKANLSRVANYLFVDPATGATRWLFPTNDQVITATDYVTKDMTNTTAVVFRDPLPAVAVVYDVKPTSASATPRKYQVYVSKLDGTGLTKLFDDLDEATTFVPSADNTIFATYNVKGRHMVSTISMADFKVVMTKDLSEYEPK